MQITAGYRGVDKENIRFVEANPRQARRFAAATGRHAKTDRVDAAMLAKMGSALQLREGQTSSQSIYMLRELTTARRALMKDKVAAAARMQSARHALLKRQFAARLKQIAVLDPCNGEECVQ